MVIKKADFLGFCFGVKRAIDIVENELNKKEKLYSLGEIIHNKDVVNKFKEKGLFVIDSIPENLDGKLIIRSHGVGKDIIDELNKKDIEYIDATCPKVKKIHKIVHENSLLGNEIIIAGNAIHPEVKGILGWATTKCYTIKGLEDFFKININKNKKYTLVSQTTFNNDELKDIIDIIMEKKYNNISIFNTICDATMKRQESCAKLSSNCDLTLIIGGKNSSNTKKLLEISKLYCNKSFHIENYKEIPYKNINKNTIVGVTAGASTPDWIIEEVIQNVRKFKLYNE